MRHRLRQARARFTGPVARTAGVATALILVLGGFIFYNTNVLNEYRTRDELGRPQAEYEKRYGRYEAVAQPTITSADLRVEIYPDEAGVEIRGSYLRARANSSREVPLLEVEDQSYIAYRKGTIALYTLREHIGAGAVNAALRRYIEKYAGDRRPYPTSLDLYAELRAVTPDSLHALLEDWFETITLWDLRAERAVVEPTGTGEYVVTLDLVAKKMRADSVGNETDVPMDDFVEIGVFAPGEGAAPMLPAVAPSSARTPISRVCRRTPDVTTP